jgi:hypothetical protein
MIGWESDYPHSDGIWPDAPEKLAKVFRGIDDALINKVTHENVCAFFDFDPWKHRTKEQSTVKALRAEVTDWDVTIESAFKKRDPQTIVGQFMHMETVDEAPPKISITGI